MVRIAGAVRANVTAAALSDGRNVDLLGLGQPQRQLVAVDLHLHGVPHGGQLDHRYLCARDDPHVQKVLAQGALAAYLPDHGAFSDL